MTTSKKISIFISVIFTILLFVQLNNIHNTYIPNTNQLETNAKVNTFLENYFLENKQMEYSAIHRSEVGIFVESLSFSSANDIQVSGHIWQKIQLDNRENLVPGIVFVDAIGDVVLDKRYTKVYGSYEVHGWYFEADLRQPFKYTNYPIDHKTIWIKVKPSGFNQQQIFVPDLNSYVNTSKDDSFGISQDIVLLGWEINESFFDFLPTSYDTSFGLQNNLNHFSLPILAFNVVVNRNLVNAFMINITLLLSTMVLLYILILMITSNDKLKEEFDISVGTTVSTCAGLFFAILLAHINLREQFSSMGFVYIEFFYILNYLFITASAFIVFSFYNTKSSLKSILFIDDAVYVKLVYWPLYLSIANIYTYIHFYM